MVLKDCFDYQILKLTPEFYKHYPNPPYKEILKKQLRSYNCLLIQSHYDYFIAIPYRSEITHKYAFHFHGSKRSERHKSGLDYTKIIIIQKPEFIESSSSVIDQDEYEQTRIYIRTIQKDAVRFVDDYVSHMNGTAKLDAREFKRRYAFSPLQYFHRELGITVSSQFYVTVQPYG